jgi:hypothetical protein
MLFSCTHCPLCDLRQLFSHFSHAHARCGAAGALRCAGLRGRVGQQLARGGMLTLLAFNCMLELSYACFSAQYLVLAAETAPFLYEVEEDDDEVKCCDSQ